MQNNLNSTWIKNINIVCQNLLIPTMIILLFLYNTAVNIWVNGRIETAQNILAIVIVLVFICNIFSNPKENITNWISDNKWIVLYFVARGVSLYLSGFDYSVIRTIFFELFLLVCITESLIKKNNSLYISIFVVLQSTFTFLSLLIFYIKDYIGEQFVSMLYDMTYLDKCQNALLFGNQNSAGIMAGFAVIIAIVKLKECRNNKFIPAIYGIFNIVVLLLFGCRSAEIGLLAVMVALIIICIFKNISLKQITVIALIIGAVSIIPLYGIMEFEGGIDSLSFTETEEKIDRLSTGRYVIWKECAIEQQDSLLFGEGSLKLEQAERNALFAGATWEFREVKELGPHNGYIAMMSCTGIIGYVLFFIILLDKVLKIKNRSSYWYLVLIFIFAINCFENLFILNRFFTSFYLFYILEELK